jgi:NAD-dependent deacetylase
MKKLVVLSGAGVSAESGISTFRDSGGLWEGYNAMDVASPEGWERDQELVLNFYNERRKNALVAQPNEGHKIIAELENQFEVTVITQNVDNLHEKAGSSKVIHLHGELFKSRSTADPTLVYDINGWELKTGDLCEKGSQLRPHIVWFGEMVPMMEDAIEEACSADVFIVIGTSLQVYPAAGLLEYVKESTPKFIIDPNMPFVNSRPNLNLIEEVGSKGMQIVKKRLAEDLL